MQDSLFEDLEKDWEAEWHGMKIERKKSDN
jgi:hypothetical protein